MSDSNKRLMNIWNWMQNYTILHCLLIVLFYCFVQLTNLMVVQNYWYYLQWNQSWYVLDWLTVSVHANISQKIHISQEVIPFWSPVFEELWNWTEILLTKSNFHLVFQNLVINWMICWQLQWIDNLFFLLLLKLKFETPQVINIFEETVQNNLLIFLNDTILALNKSREESQVLGCKESFPSGLLEERID